MGSPALFFGKFTKFLTKAIILPKDTLANLNALPRNTGALAYATDSGAPAYDTGTAYQIFTTVGTLLTTDNTGGNLTVASGTTLTYFDINVQSGNTYTINGTLVTGNATVSSGGTLTVNGKARFFF